MTQKTLSMILFLAIGFLNACESNPTIENIAVPTEATTQQNLLQEDTLTLEPILTVTSTQQLIIPTLTPSPFPNATTTPIIAVDYIDPSIIGTKFPVTPLPAYTPLPTLSSNDAADTLLDLLQNNAGCQLPCWWGAIPGQTLWDDADALLASMNAEYYEPNRNSHEIYLPHVPEELPNEHPLGFRLFYGTQQGIIQGIDVESAPTSNYFLASILLEYGPPEEVLIDTMSEPREGFLPFRLVLIYWEQGFAVRLFDDAEVIDSMVTACFPANGQQNPSLFLWAVNNYTFSTPELLEGSGFAGFGEGEYYLPLEGVTDLDISAFYETYKESSDNSCLQTPQEMWFF